MKNRIIYGALIILFIFITPGCTSKNNINDNKTNQDIKIDNSKDEVSNTMNLTINDNTYLINLEDNETVESLIKMLPLSLNMSELNGNEKYVYLDNILPTSSINPNHINAGDVMLYGNNCLVIFYKSFDTNYSYTKIGHIDNLPDLGSNSISVRIEK